MTNFWILMLIAITISLASQFFIKKKYGIDKSGWRYKHVSNTHNGSKSLYLFCLCFHSPFFQLNICFFYFLL